MKGSVWFAAAVVALCASFGLAATFEVEITATSSTAVAPGGTVDYEITGLVSSGDNLGLALCGVDLTTDTVIAQGQAVEGGSMGPFVKDDGITNPAGYGGTVDADDLLQIGGGQNTIGNDGISPHPAYPSGVVVEGIAQGSSVVLATGTITAPGTPGTHTVSLVDPFANVLLADQGGGVYTVEAAAASVGASGSFQINVGDPILLPASCDPVADGTLPKTQANVIWLVFDRAISLPGSNPVTIQDIQDINPETLGADIAGQFDFSLVETNLPNDTLKCKNAGAALPNMTWYRVKSVGAFQVVAFVHDVCTLVGDANDNGRVNTVDYSTVEAHIGERNDRRYDLNGNDRTNTIDYTVVQNQMGDRAPLKPDP